MRAVIQRVKSASAAINNLTVGEIGRGLLVLIAIHENDCTEAVAKMADKIINLRIFGDQTGKMNLSVKDVNGEILVVSQFTLYGDASKGNQPSFINLAKPTKAIPIYDKFVSYIKEQGIKVATGGFGALMTVALINDGPVTIILDI